MTRKQINRWLDYYLWRISLAMRTDPRDDQYIALCWRRIFVLRELENAT